MASKEAVEKVKADLGSLKTDFKDAKITTRIDSVTKVDGKILANYSVSGLPTKKNEYSDSYRNWQKIFDDWSSFNAYTEKFFDSEEFLLNEAKNKNQ